MAAKAQWLDPLQHNSPNCFPDAQAEAVLTEGSPEQLLSQHLVKIKYELQEDKY